MDGEDAIFEVIHYAQLRNDAPIIVRNWLMDAANNPNITDEHAFSLLHWAVIGNNIEIIVLLLDHGARVNVMNAGGDTPLHLAAQLNRVDAAGILLQVAGIMNSTPNSHGNTPLHYATFFNCHNVAVLLAAHGAPLNVQNKDGLTPLMIASSDLAAELKDISAGVKGNNSPTPMSAPSNLTSPGTTVTDGPVASGVVDTIGLANLDLREKISESRDATCWFGSCDGVPVVARSVHLRRRGPLASRLAVQLLAETERLRSGRGTLTPHLNVLPLLLCLIDNQGAGEPLLLSRYQQLGSLFDVLHSGSLGNRPKFVLDQRQTYRIALDIANGMEYIHNALQDSAALMPRFHLNSRNVLLDIDANDASQEPVARLYLAKSDLPGTTDTRIVHHPAWFAPEELLHPPHAVKIQPADMWSMGVVLYELVTLCIPFAGLTAVEIGIKVALEGARVHLYAKAPGISAHVDRLLGICMNENPECRPSFDQIVPVFRRMVAAANANGPS